MNGPLTRVWRSFGADDKFGAMLLDNEVVALIW